MNFKKQAQKLESFLDEEFRQKQPIALLPNGNIAYNNFIIKKNKKDQWCLYRNGSLLDSFNLKASSLIAAKLFSLNSFGFYSELKVLDEFYNKNNLDALIFKQQHSRTKDNDLKDLYIARFEIAESKSRYAKQRIADKFRALFDK